MTCPTIVIFLNIRVCKPKPHCCWGNYRMASIPTGQEEEEKVFRMHAYIYHWHDKKQASFIKIKTFKERKKWAKMKTSKGIGSKSRYS